MRQTPQLRHLYLSNSTSLRMTAFSVLYFAQGVPIGLFTIALPPYLIAQGADAGDVAALIAITGLPWAFKLIAGPFMDRFAFPHMGRRRPWVLLAQLGLTLSILLLAGLVDPAEQLGSLITIGFVINAFAATQDVAVDGMAIDTLPLNERGRANAFMAFGQVAGFSAFGALNGFLLTHYGLTATALASATVVGLILGFVTLTRERTGERLLPWTAGGAPVVEQQPQQSFLVIFKDLARALLLPMSLLLIGVEFLSRMAAGVTVSILPVIAVQDLGYSAAQYSYWIGLAGGIAAVVGVFFGPLIDRFGAQRLLMGALIGNALITLLFALTTTMWGSHTFIASMLVVGQIFGQVFFVAVIAIFMGMCWAKVAATQFAIYMSLANLGRSVGAGLFAIIANDLSSVQSLYLITGLFIVAAMLLTLFNSQQHAERLEALDPVDLEAAET
jgi:PAT family beta-lactamase induction signal transducer AmpG